MDQPLLASTLALDSPLMLLIYSRMCQTSSATVTPTVSENQGFHGNRGLGPGKAKHAGACFQTSVVFRGELTLSPTTPPDHLHLLSVVVVVVVGGRCSHALVRELRSMRAGPAFTPDVFER